MREACLSFLCLLNLFLLPFAAHCREDAASLFVRELQAGRLVQAEKLLAIDADADLRLALLRPEDAALHQKTFQQLKFHSQYSAGAENWSIYQVESSAEYLLFVLTDEKIRRMIPLSVPSIRQFRLHFSKASAAQRRVAGQVITARLQQFSYVYGMIEEKEADLLLHCIGFEDEQALRVLMTAGGEFSLRRLSRGRKRLPWATLEGISSPAPHAVDREAILTNQQLRRASWDANSLGLLEIRLETDAEGRRRLTREHQDNASRKAREYVAVLDGRILRRVSGPASFPSGIVFLEGIPHQEDARILTALMANPPLPSSPRVLAVE